MARVLCVSANISREPFPVYPLGMAIVAAGLAGAGHDVDQFDFLAAGESDEKLKERVERVKPDYVCISIRNLDNCDSVTPASFPHVVERIVSVVRGSVAAPVILGGAAFSILPDDLLDFSGADYGIVGEGERVVVDLLAALEAGRPVPRLTRVSRKLAGSEMVAPLFTKDLVEFYVGQSGLLNIQTKRGCPFQCSYCPCPALEGHQFRFREPSAVVDDMARAKAEFGVDNFFFIDSIFNDPQRRYLAIGEELLRRQLDVRWCCNMRPTDVGRPEIALLKRAGMYAIEFGTDAACDATLAAMNKGFTFDDVMAASEACVAERMPCAHFVMFGGPGETRATLAEGLANMDRLDHCVVFAYSGIRILPGTTLFSQAVAEGVIAADTPLRDPIYYVAPGLDPEEMNRTITAAFRGRRDRLFPPIEGQKRMDVMNQFGFRGLLWDQLVRFPQA